MALALSAAVPAFAPTAQPMRSQPAAANVRMEAISDLETLAPKLNPKVGFWDPLNLSGGDFWGLGETATVGWLRHAEIKHGRIAMFAFVGYCAQANGIHWPGNLNTAGLSFAQVSAAGSPFEQWDALPSAAKLQILGAIGLFEWFGESKYALEQSGEKHYMRG